MKVLKDNYNKIDNKSYSYPRKTICENCGSELEYEKDDIRIGWLGAVYVDCPLCGFDNMLYEHEDCVTLTVDNLEFPTHFHHTCVENGAVDCVDNTTIKHYLNKAIKYFRENKDEFVWHSQTGNMDFAVFRWSGYELYKVVVTGNYFEADIPFEEIDYE